MHDVRSEFYAGSLAQSAAELLKLIASSVVVLSLQVWGYLPPAQRSFGKVGLSVTEQCLTSRGPPGHRSMAETTS